MACCKVCCGCKECDEGEEGKCCCGLDCCQPGTYCCNGACVETCGEGGVGPCKCGSSCCAEGEYCCDGVCQAEPCGCETDEDCPADNSCCGGQCCHLDRCCGCVDSACDRQGKAMYLLGSAVSDLCTAEDFSRCDCNLFRESVRPCVDPEDVPATQAGVDGTLEQVGPVCECGFEPVVVGWPLDSFPISAADYEVECWAIPAGSSPGDPDYPPVVDPDWYPAICDPP